MCVRLCVYVCICVCDYVCVQARERRGTAVPMEQVLSNGCQLEWSKNGKQEMETVNLLLAAPIGDIEMEAGNGTGEIFC